MYKKLQNHVRTTTGEIFKFLEPQDVLVKMKKLLDFINDNASNEENLFYNLAKIHYDFIMIHPFDDGNGRIGRILINYVLLKQNLPPLIIKFKDKEEYFTCLQKADKSQEKNLSYLQNFLERSLEWSVKLYLKASKGENIRDYDDVDKEFDIWQRNKNNLTKIKNNNILSF